MMIDLTDNERRVLLDACNDALACDDGALGDSDRELLRNLRVKLTQPGPPLLSGPTVLDGLANIFAPQEEEET